MATRQFGRNQRFSFNIEVSKIPKVYELIQLDHGVKTNSYNSDDTIDSKEGVFRTGAISVSQFNNMYKLLLHRLSQIFSRNLFEVLLILIHISLSKVNTSSIIWDWEGDLKALKKSAESHNFSQKWCA